MVNDDIETIRKRKFNQEADVDAALDRLEAEHDTGVKCVPLSMHRDEVERLRGQESSLRRAYEEERAVATGAQRENERLREELSDVRRGWQEQTAIFVQERSEVERLQGELKTGARQYNVVLAEVEKLRGERQNLLDDLARAKLWHVEEVERLREAAVQLTMKADESQDEVERLLVEREQGRAYIDTVQAEVERLQFDEKCDLDHSAAAFHELDAKAKKWQDALLRHHRLQTREAERDNTCSICEDDDVVDSMSTDRGLMIYDKSIKAWRLAEEEGSGND